MSKAENPDTDDSSNPLHGKAPAPDELKDDRPDGETPNASEHVKAEPEWKGRPEQYPAAKTGLLNTDVPGAGQAR